ncbi:MAG: 30S ribosomal protein S12 methylthiotransferase RimO [Propionibacteriaceae bacterium]|nr:30S ribosomal protein S12 methylthiotransferase RimO [Propionibacteriaceae bacterium]
MAPIPLSIRSLGCARNDVDSEELAARFVAGGFTLVDTDDEAEVIVVNTCGFIEAAKTESIDELLSASELKTKAKKTVIATGCLAQRYGLELAETLGEVDGVFGFDHYEQISSRVREILERKTGAPGHIDARRRLPLVSRQLQEEPSQPRWTPSRRLRVENSPMAPLKIATGCDRRCSFCAIPSIRGPFTSRPVSDIVDEARWLVSQGVKELFLVSENTTSYGKDIGGVTLPKLLGELAHVDGLEWIRLSYLQPDEVNLLLVETIASTSKVVPYFDLPFQHASKSVLERMRRRGDQETYLSLLSDIRRLIPHVGIRTNVIVGFPGETEEDLEILTQFLGSAHFDALGVFPYSDEEGTHGASLHGHLDDDEIRARTASVLDFSAAVMASRALERVGEKVSVLVLDADHGSATGRSEQQGPEDGQSLLSARYRPGDIVEGVIDDTQGVDWLIRV